MSHPIVENAFKEFSEVGRIAVVVELKLRLLASKISQVQTSAHARNISDTEAAVLPYLFEQKLISSEEKNHLEQSRKIRNKIFHCEFESAVKLIETLRKSQLPSGILVGARINGLEGDNILDKIMGFSESVQKRKQIKGTFKIDQSTTKEAGIFGCLIDALAKGVLTEGQKIINESSLVLDRVFAILAKQEY